MRRDRAGNDVVDIRESARHPAFVKDLYRLAGQYRLRKKISRHVRTPPRAVHGKIPQARSRHAIQVAESVRDQLTAALRGGVERHRVIHAILDAEGLLLV